jgi:response regulator NasT
MTGIDAAKKLHELYALPCLIVSAYSDDTYVAEIQKSGLASGVYGYLIKPVAPEELRVMLGMVRHRAAVDGHHTARIEQLQGNLLNRRQIEQAKWKLVELLKISEPSAHDMLQRTARNRRVPLIDIAREILSGQASTIAQCTSKPGGGGSTNGGAASKPSSSTTEKPSTPTKS